MTAAFYMHREVRLRLVLDRWSDFERLTANAAEFPEERGKWWRYIMPVSDAHKLYRLCESEGLDRNDFWLSDGSPLSCHHSHREST